MLRASILFVVLGLASQSGASSAAPIQPTSKWEVQYSDRACTAKRTFGDTMLAIRPSPLGKTVRFVVEAPGEAKSVRQYGSTIDLRNGGPSIQSSSMIYPLTARKRRGLTTIVAADDARRVMGEARFTIWSGDKLVKRVDGLPNSPRVMAADLAIGPMGGLAKALDKCVGDLQRHWGMVDGKLPERMNSAPPSGNVQGIFTDQDFPVDRIDYNKITASQALLMIDEAGNVVDCVTMQTSGSAAIDAVVCQAIEERAKFRPALDAQGRPVRSTTMTPPILFKIAR